MAGALARDVVEGVPEELQLAVSADHGDVCPADERRRLGVQREQTVRRHGLRFPLRVQRRDSLDRDGVANEPDRVRADEDLAGLGGLLEARGDVDRVSRRESLLGAGHDLARVDPDAQTEAPCVIALELGVQGVERPKLAAARTARKASSSCTCGTPKTAMTASPMNFSTELCRGGRRPGAQLEVAREHAAEALQGRAARRERSSRSRPRRAR